MKLVRPLVLFCVSAAAISSVRLPAFSAPTQMTSDQVLDRCRKAYDALQSYDGTTNVSTVSNIGGIQQHFNTSAHIRFVRSGKIRVEGSLTMTGRYAFVSDGRSTWSASSFQGGQWQPVQSTDMAIASFTGVSMQAATTIPAILLHTTWGTPFTTTKVDPNVTQETVGGHATYRVTTETPTGGRTFWVDRTSFLLVRSRIVTNLGKTMQLMGKMPKLSKMPKMPKMPTSVSGSMEGIEEYVNVRLNSQLPPRLFTQPSGAL